MSNSSVRHTRHTRSLLVFRLKLFLPLQSDQNIYKFVEKLSSAWLRTRGPSSFRPEHDAQILFFWNETQFSLGQVENFENSPGPILTVSSWNIRFKFIVKNWFSPPPLPCARENLRAHVFPLCEYAYNLWFQQTNTSETAEISFSDLSILSFLHFILFRFTIFFSVFVENLIEFLYIIFLRIHGKFQNAAAP